MDCAGLLALGRAAFYLANSRLPNSCDLPPCAPCGGKRFDDRGFFIGVANMTDEEFFALCQSNETVLFEREPNGEIIERPLAGWQTSLRSVEVTRQLGDWIKRDGSGLGFGALTGFALPNGAVRGPYAAWVLRSQIESLTAEEKKGFLPLSPDFVVELVSDQADLSYFHKKMAEYVSCGSRLGWLIDYETRTVFIYRPNAAVEELKDTTEVSADPELPGFVLDLREIWDPPI
ncbi:MAG: Uma2 family endonuclease [Blastocatellia bacterium]